MPIFTPPKNENWIDEPPTETPYQPIFTLTPAERALADKLGKEKNDKSESVGLQADWYDTHGGSTTDNHQDGVAAEMCHVLFTGHELHDFETRYYRVDTFKMADWGDNTEVRGTKMTHYAGKVKDRDLNKRIVVFYRKLNQLQFQALGWLTVKEAKRIGDYLDPGNRNKWAYFVKDRELHPLKTIPKDSELVPVGD